MFQIGGHGDVFLLVLVEHLHHLVIHNGDVKYIHGFRVEKTMKGLGVIKGLDLGLVEPLSKLAPHGIEHHFG